MVSWKQLEHCCILVYKGGEKEWEEERRLFGGVIEKNGNQTRVK